MLVEAGKQRRDELGPLVARVDLPARWRFLLITPSGGQGLSGEAEMQAFDRLPAIPLLTTERLCRLALLDMLPAAQAGDFAHFSQAYFDYGHLAGACFATEQGSAYASPRLAEIVGRVRAMGIGGIIQSSWGPTLAALLPDRGAAGELEQVLRADPVTADATFEIAAPINHGAMIRASPPSQARCCDGLRPPGAAPRAARDRGPSRPVPGERSARSAPG